ncbi:hypothetical protein JCM10212_002782 [Sporobolomyces blumeae]
MRWTALLVALACPLASGATSIHAESLSLVDLLSASPDHSLLLRAFQRARLVPTLNRLNGSTLFAPTNEAIRRAQEDEGTGAGLGSNSVWTALDLGDDGADEVGENDGRDGHDNLQLALRETLLYHCLNYTLFPPPRSNSSRNSSIPSTASRLAHHLPLDVPTLQETLLFPTLSPYDHEFPTPPSLPGSEPDKPDPGAPTDRPEGLLRGEGQRVRVLRKMVASGFRKSKEPKEQVMVGVDWKGDGGVKVDRKVEFAKNGVLVSVDGVLHRPPSLAEIIRTDPALTTFASLLPTQVLDYLSTVSHMTLFAPTNEAWASLSDLELRYLRSGLAEMDIAEIFGDGASRNGAGKGKVGYLEKLVGEAYDGETNVTTLRNGTLEVAADGDVVKVNGTRVETGDVLAKNGVLHTVPSLLLPSGSLSLTAEKYLIALNATRFVSLLRSVNLSHYVQIPTDESTVVPVKLPTFESKQLPLVRASDDNDGDDPKRYTILAVTDDVLISVQARWGSSFPSPGSPELRRLLSYHLVTGRWNPTELVDGMLLGTELRPSELKGQRQRVAVSVQDEEGLGAGWERKAAGSKDKETVIGWGNANAVTEPVSVGNSIIYLLSTIIDPPAPVITAAVSDLRLSTFVAAVYAGALDGTLATHPAVTYLVPTNQAFQSLGLVMSYLLLPSARDELRSMLEYHAIDELVYLEGFPRTGSARYPTLLDGAEIYLNREDTNSTLTVHGPTLGGLPANGETRDARVLEGDVLTETGVLHVVDQVELPAELDITVEKLLRGAKTTTMVELIKAANLSWVLEGKKPPADFVFAYDDDRRRTSQKNRDVRRPNVSRAYTILCPTDKALSRLNLTFYAANPAKLSALVKLHIIPTDALSPGKTYLDHPTGGDDEGTPIVLTDSITYPTLQSRAEGGPSKFGTVAFKKWGTEQGSWMVGIQGARGTKGESDSARVIAWGRATPWFVDDAPDDVKYRRVDAYVPGVGSRQYLSNPKVAAGGGVILIDSVLLPYEPGWFRRWGWIVVVAAVSTLVVAGLVAFGVKKWRSKSSGERYERLEGEED